MLLECHQFRSGRAAQAEKLGVHQAPEAAGIDGARHQSQGFLVRSPDGDRQIGHEPLGGGVLGQERKPPFRAGPGGRRRAELLAEGPAEPFRSWVPVGGRMQA